METIYSVIRVSFFNFEINTLHLEKTRKANFTRRAQKLEKLKIIDFVLLLTCFKASSSLKSFSNRNYLNWIMFHL